VRCKRWANRVWLLFLALCVAACGRESERLEVFAAASLRDVCLELAPQFERQSGTSVLFNFGASSELARQLCATTRGDVFLSADDVQHSVVDAARGTLDTSRRIGNQLAVVAREPVADFTPAHFTRERFVLADPRIVPAGRYARRWLTDLGLWEQAAPRVVSAKDARAALAAVEAGAAPLGVVYATDAARSQRVRLVFSVPLESGPAIRYPFCVLSDSQRPSAARAFHAFLTSEAALAVFRSHGFFVHER